jgi:hypothetical protein
MFESKQNLSKSLLMIDEIIDDFHECEIIRTRSVIYREIDFCIRFHIL